ncbi:acyl-CoA dehydrogenase family protein [Cytobacillus sp. S13-E01]|uniref:acyl-CoA dehydrogenase family protein n=1 Tax=Cytobacillus sp. S13-E01 TaxID=3031326 RepID=UPI0023D7D7AD|nr:acyl-CoA dehydrogenase family protein [Cytobacillus sp. S13-E01]MDF0725509.1 acyl-CoA dehydrogenase family protein [Cytobacillus sp. S13-E01]
MSKPYFTEEHEIFRKSFRKFLAQHAVPYFEEWEQAKQVPKSFWQKAGEQSFLCPWVDEKYGLEADFAYSVIITEEKPAVTVLEADDAENSLYIRYNRITKWGRY